MWQQVDISRIILVYRLLLQWVMLSLSLGLGRKAKIFGLGFVLEAEPKFSALSLQPVSLALYFVALLSSLGPCWLTWHFCI